MAASGQGRRLGLTDFDLAHVKSFIADPEKILGRATSKTFQRAAEGAALK